MTDALKPCPFCGNAGSGPIEDALHVSEMDMQGTWKASYAYSVQCDKCTATMGYSESEEEAIAAWNNRADTATPAPADPLADERVRNLRGCASMVFLHMSSRDGVCTVPLWVVNDLRAALAAIEGGGQ